MANTSSFYGNLEGNATSADKINHTLIIGDKVFDGIANIEISKILIANGGTGATTAEDALVNLNALSNNFNTRCRSSLFFTIASSSYS